MGKTVKKEAMQLGLTNLPRYTFYTQPRKVKAKFSRVKPDTAYIVEDWMTKIDPSTKMSESGGRTSQYHFLAPGLNLYVEVVSKMFAKSRFTMYNADKQVSKFDIFTNNQDYVRTLVKGMNDIWEDGMVPHLNFEKLKKKFKVGKEDIINAWNSFL
ncbi:MAG: hypothetical protein R3255_05635 [Candidatus Lokiarchaeia archaeon]|nr:hypothetical protein [Candidatus Lokiarchaeia archaeon]